MLDQKKFGTASKTKGILFRDLSIKLFKHKMGNKLDSELFRIFKIFIGNIIFKKIFF